MPIYLLNMVRATVIGEFFINFAYYFISYFVRCSHPCRHSSPPKWPSQPTTEVGKHLALFREELERVKQQLAAVHAAGQHVSLPTATHSTPVAPVLRDLASDILDLSRTTNAANSNMACTSPDSVTTPHLTLTWSARDAFVGSEAPHTSLPLGFYSEGFICAFRYHLTFWSGWFNRYLRLSLLPPPLYHMRRPFPWPLKNGLTSSSFLCLSGFPLILMMRRRCCIMLTLFECG